MKKTSIAEIEHLIKVQCQHINETELSTNLITILVALLAAIIALYQVKANIISNSRINWIENLRQDISLYCSEISNCGLIIQNMHDATKDKDNEELVETLKQHYPLYHQSANKSELLGNKVKLYLNSDEAIHKKIEDLINGISDHLHKNKTSELNRSQLHSDIDEIIFNAKIIFKQEWKKSKKIYKI